VFVCTEDEQMEQCDDTASPNEESPSETGDSDIESSNSLSDYSYSDSSDSNSSSLREVSICVLNGTENVDLTIQRKSKKPNSRKGKRTIQ
jgi:hypothetical protein